MKMKIIVMIALSLLMVGCAEKHVSSNTPKPTSQTQNAAATSSALPSDYLVSKVVVNLGANLNPDHVASAKSYNIVGHIQDDVTAKLMDAHHFDAEHGSLTLYISVNHFRLRSGASAFWLGVMAGADSIAVDVKASQEDKILEQFHTDTSTALGGFAFASPTERVNRMVKTLSKRIVAGM